VKLKLLNESIPKVKKGLGLSLSKIKMYENCPYRYYLQYFAKEKFDKADYNPKFFKIGQFAHKYIESKIKGTECKFNSTTMSDNEKEKTMGNCNNVFKNEYIKSLLKKGVAEQGFSMNINPMKPDGLEATEKYSRSADFSGYIDFFAIDKGVAHVIDWKTGSIKGDDDDTFMQLMLYAKAISMFKSGVNRFKLSFFYIDHNEIVTRNFSKSELDKKIQKIVEKGINIPTTDNVKLFPATPGNVCKYCPYSKVRSSDNKIPCKFAK